MPKLALKIKLLQILFQSYTICFTWAGHCYEMPGNNSDYQVVRSWGKGATLDSTADRIAPENSLKHPLQ